MTNLLVELQTEELPPKALKQLSEAFANGVFDKLTKLGFTSDSSKLTIYGAPRRLACHITDVLSVSPDVNFTQKLVPVKVGLDAEGKATAVLEKKMKALGICAEVEDLQKVDDGKNVVLVYSGVKPGVELSCGLQDALDDSIRHLPIPKVMTYQLADGVTTVEFVRPVRHVVALHGKDVVAVKLFGLDAGRVTMGHRFHTSEPIEIKCADCYEKTMREHHVVPSYEERREEIRRMINETAKEVGGTPIMPDDLLDEVTALTEWPVVYKSEFDKEFLSVPEECLILTMQLNQKYFALRDANHKLMNTFILVSQINAKDDGAAISSGNARVVRARLADAKFFYDQDRLSTLESRVDGLKHVVYQNKLGSQAERMLRVKSLAGAIAKIIGANSEFAERAALLAKADLRTLMVGEFPELQGIMGEYYAQNDGEAHEVALAIKEHYQPRQAGGELPSTLVSLAVALADKLETLTGLFGINQAPTGEKDPYSLRRHALGVIRMLMEKNLKVRLEDLLSLAWETELKVDGVTDHSEELAGFIHDRLRVLLKDSGYSHNEVDAVLAIPFAYLDELPLRLEAVRVFMGLEEAQALAAANKRIGNILKKSEGGSGEVNPTLFTEEAEKNLWVALSEVAPKAEELFVENKYTEMLQTLAQLKKPVDEFFESVMVNVSDPTIKANRLALLSKLYVVMNKVAEIARLG